MSTVLDETVSHQATAPAQRLSTTMAAVRVSVIWLGVRKTLTPEQKAEAAEPFGTDARFLSAGKRLLDTSHPAYKAVTAVRGRIIAFWRAMSLPYPEAGIRLIRQDRIDDFAMKMRELQQELADGVATLDRHYSEPKTTARQRLPTSRPATRVTARYVSSACRAPAEGTVRHPPGHRLAEVSVESGSLAARTARCVDNWRGLLARRSLSAAAHHPAQQCSRNHQN